MSELRKSYFKNTLAVVSGSEDATWSLFFG